MRGRRRRESEVLHWEDGHAKVRINDRMIGLGGYWGRLLWMSRECEGG
jgi:hypothetical protein